MLKNPFINALWAGGYITLVVLFMNKVIKALDGADDNLFIPMTMLSLFVLSVAVMALLFFYEPVRLLLEGEKRHALYFLAKTILSFAVFVIVLIILLLSTSLFV